MEVGLAILLFICMTALLYVLLSLKITRQVDLQMKEFYKTRIYSDIQEFYRVMEGNAALMENRIQRFKSLVERSEALAGRSAWAKAAEPQEIPQLHLSATAEHTRNRKAAPQKPAAGENKKQSDRHAKKGVKFAPAKPAKGRQAKRQVAEPARPAVTATERVHPVRPQPEPVRPATVSDFGPQISAAASESGIDADTTIAEELMKDLFAQDEMQLSRRVNATADNAVPATQRPAKPTEQTQSETGSVAGILASIGKVLKPVVFGERPQAISAAAEPAAPAQLQLAAKEVPDAKTTDFAEVLRRAEQIKAQKKAERERAAIEARAEFYSSGDAFVASGRAGSRGDGQATAQTAASVAYAAGKPEMPARNSLAVKSLDEHTISFLIDSLKHDAGYRRQALRALTENNIPLEEIARLSRIDIGELQLMSQLGKF